MAKQKEKEAKLLEKAAKSNATGQNNGMRKSQRRNSDKNLAGPNSGTVEATKTLTARQKSLQESTKVKKQKSKPMPPPQTPPNHQKETLPPPVLGTVTFLGMIFSNFDRYSREITGKIVRWKSGSVTLYRQVELNSA